MWDADIHKAPNKWKGNNETCNTLCEEKAKWNGKWAPTWFEKETGFLKIPMPLALPISNIEINQAKNKEMKKKENLLEREINKGSHHPL